MENENLKKRQQLLDDVNALENDKANEEVQNPYTEEKSEVSELEALRSEMEDLESKRKMAQLSDMISKFGQGLSNAASYYSAANPYGKPADPIMNKIDTDSGMRNFKEEREDLMRRVQQAQQSARQRAQDAYKMQELEERRENRKLKRDLAEKQYGQKKKEKETKLTEGQKALDKQFAKEHATYSLGGGYASVKKNLSQLENVVDQLEKDPTLTGGVLEKVLPAGVADYQRTLFDEEAQDVKDIVEQVIQQSLRQTLGAQFTEKEAARLIERSYNPRLSADKNIARLKETIKEIDQMAKEKESAGKYFEENGTLQGYKSNKNTESKKSNEVKRMTKDGRTAIFNADTKEFIRYE